MVDVFPEEQQPQIRAQLANILEVVIAQRLIPLDHGGRRAVAEILVVNPAIRNLIRESKAYQIDNVIRTSSDVGMISLERSLVDLVRDGVISIKTAQEYAVYPEEVSRLLKS
jgi:twitching motility protein PilT